MLPCFSQSIKHTLVSIDVEFRHIKTHVCWKAANVIVDLILLKFGSSNGPDIVEWSLCIRYVSWPCGSELFKIYCRFDSTFKNGHWPVLGACFVFVWVSTELVDDEFLWAKDFKEVKLWGWWFGHDSVLWRLTSAVDGKSLRDTDRCFGWCSTLGAEKEYLWSVL